MNHWDIRHSGILQHPLSRYDKASDTVTGVLNSSISRQKRLSVYKNDVDRPFCLEADVMSVFAHVVALV